MSLQSRLLLSLTVVAAMVGTLGQQLEKIYAIHNAHHGTYLEALNNGQICERLSDVINSGRLNRESEGFRWRISTFSNNQVFIETDNRDLRINELTMYSQPPFCFPAIQVYEIVYVIENASMIKNPNTGSCLTANSVSQRISWDKCRSDQRNQLWNFIDWGALADSQIES